MGQGGRKAVVAGLARDCAKHLPAVFANIERLASLFDETTVVVAENDSTDGTRELLQGWCGAGASFRLIDLNGLSQRLRARTVRLAEARNRVIETIRADPILAQFDYLVWLDLDEVAVRPLDLTALRRALDFLDETPTHAAVFANQLGIYYDIWALRSPTNCPGDAWQEVQDEVNATSCSDEEAFARTFRRRIFVIDPALPPLRVDSAFGGLGIYKLSYALKGRYVGHAERTGAPGVTLQVQCCEHVAFNRDIAAAGGELFVAPWLINADMTGLTFPPWAYLTFLIGARGPNGPIDLSRLGRNETCPCGSKRRYKHCHGGF